MGGSKENDFMDSTSVVGLFVELKRSIDTLAAEVGTIHRLVAEINTDRQHIDRRLDELSADVKASRESAMNELGGVEERVDARLAELEDHVPSINIARAEITDLKNRVAALETESQELGFVRRVTQRARGWLTNAVAAVLIGVIFLGMIAIVGGYIAVNSGMFGVKNG
jgi:chromosome segregation ATPase